MTYRLLFTLLAISFVASPRSIDAQQPTAEEREPSSQQPSGDEGTETPQDREQRLASYLSGIKFVGSFTVDGKSDAAPKQEEYTISQCEKLELPDMYRLTARIKYGDVDNEVPMDIKILWSGNTPVITLDALWIPGMGTFSARVLIHADRYAGTW